MLYQRFAAVAAVLFLLGGCSFFGFWDAPETPAQVSKVDSQGPGSPLEGRQLAALPGYLSDQDVVPGRIAAPGRIEVLQGFIGRPAVRPAWPTAALQAPPVARRVSLKDLLPRDQILDLQPIAAAFEPGSFTLADLIADRNWRKQTSETLSRLFQ